MKNYLKGWKVMRILRLVLGVYIIIEGIQTNEWLFIALGGLFTAMPLLNIGCCGVSGCSTAVPKSNGKMEDVTYEAIK